MNFYANIRNAKYLHQVSTKTGRSPTVHNTGDKKSGYDINEDRILTLRVNAVRDKHRDDPEILEDLENKIGAFIVNVSIARNLGVKKQEKQLRKEFSNYLNTL